MKTAPGLWTLTVIIHHFRNYLQREGNFLCFRVHGNDEWINLINRKYSPFITFKPILFYHDAMCFTVCWWIIHLSTIL